MTGEKKRTTLVVTTAVSAFAWVACALAAIWHAQNDGLAWAWFWAILAIAPAAVLYEVLRRWNRG